MSLPNLEMISWRDVKAKVALCNPAIFQAVSGISGSDSWKCVIARYQFGQEIIQNGRAHFVSDHGLEGLDVYRQHLPFQIKHVLDYPWQHYPISLLLNKQVEVYFDLSTHLAPLKILQPGMLLTVNNILKVNALSLVQHGVTFSAGCNSVFALPKIGHVVSNRRLQKRFDLDQLYCPKKLSDQNEVLKALAQSPGFGDDWRSEVLMFGSEFADKIEHHPGLRMAFMNQALQQSTNYSDASMMDVLWSLFINRKDPRVHCPVVVYDTAKHLIQLMLGRLPGFVPAEDDAAAPVTQFMKTYVDKYKIRYYLPVFMRPASLSEEPIYYSLQKPSFLHPVQVDHNSARTILILQNLRGLIAEFLDYVGSSKCPIQLPDSWIYQTLSRVSIDYYHPKMDGAKFSDLERFLLEDPRFSTLSKSLAFCDKLSFPIHSSFFQGCLRLRYAKVASEKPKMREFLSQFSLNKG